MRAAIPSSHMATDITALAGVLRIDTHHGDTYELGLVLDKEAQLRKGPAGHSGALRLPEPRPLADILEIFQGNATVGALGCRNERLTNAMVGISTKPGFSPCGTFQGPADVLGTLARHLGVVRSFLQPLPTPAIARATRFDACAAVCDPVTRGGQIDHAQVNPKKVGRRKGRPIRDLDDHQQKPLAVLTHDQMALPGFMSVEALLMVGTNQERH